MQSKSTVFGQRMLLRQPTIIRRPADNPETAVLVSHAAAPLHAPTKAVPAEQRPAYTAQQPPVETAEPVSQPADDAEAGAGMAKAASPTAEAPPEANAGPEGRWARRTAARLGGQIVNPGLQGPVPCVIKDMSSTGARLELQAQRGGPISRERVPDQFTLYMPTDRVEVECQVMWRQGQLLGVRYTSPARRTAKQQPIKKPEQPKKPHTSLINLLINPL